MLKIGEKWWTGMRPTSNTRYEGIEAQYSLQPHGVRCCEAPATFSCCPGRGGECGECGEGQARQSDVYLLPVARRVTSPQVYNTSSALIGPRHALTLYKDKMMELCKVCRLLGY